MSGKHPPCLGCGGRTKTVSVETVTSLVSARTAQDNSGFRFCPATSCDVVYSQGATDTRIPQQEVDVQVFQKSTDPSRPVCYCFGYSVRDVEADGPAVIRDIESKCRAGLDRCKECNPQGRCCLGNVRKVASAAGEGSLAGEASGGSCCDAVQIDQQIDQPDRESPAAQAGRWATGGAIVAAMLSSACCWLPLTLIALGASAGSAGAFFEGYRVPLLGITVVLLGTGFFFVYVRKPVCEPGEACSTPNPKLGQLNKIMLWVATALATGFALFPSYVTRLVGGSEPTVARAATPAAASPLDAVIRTYSIEGMSCEGCIVHIEEALVKVPNVSSVSVVFAEKVAHVTFAPGAAPDDAAVIAAVDDTGFEAVPSGANKE